MLPVILFARSKNCKYSKYKCLQGHKYAAPVTPEIQQGLPENQVAVLFYVLHFVTTNLVSHCASRNRLRMSAL
jgi:hypothetical protein